MVAQAHRTGQQFGLEALRSRPAVPATGGRGRPATGAGRSGSDRTAPSRRTHGDVPETPAAGDAAGAPSGARRRPTDGDSRSSGARRRPTDGDSAVSGARRRPTEANWAVSSAVRRPPDDGRSGTTERSRTIGRPAVAAESASAERARRPEGWRATDISCVAGPRTDAGRLRRRRGDAPAGGAWSGRSTPSPRPRRARPAPRPGTSRSHRAATRAVRPPTRHLPDRPRWPGVDW